jgi:hypothetical protein
VERDQGPARRDQRGAVTSSGSGGALPQGDDRKQADDADNDQRGLEQATHHVGERDALALAPTEQNCDSSGKPP